MSQKERLRCKDCRHYGAPTPSNPGQKCYRVRKENSNEPERAPIARRLERHCGSAAKLYKPHPTSLIGKVLHGIHKFITR